MPELPEVETTKEGLLPLIGHSVVSLYMGKPLREQWPNSLNEHLFHQKLVFLKRRAKYILMGFENGGTLILHLGMSGKISLSQTSLKYPPTHRATHDHFELVFENGMMIRLNDPRRFGAVYWQEPDTTHIRLASLGPEPLSDLFNVDYLSEKAKNKKTAIKPFIMDQNVVVGVGNIYACEALFQSKIKPSKAINTLSQKKWAFLIKNIQDILNKALTMGGTTLKDYRNPSGKNGDFVKRLKVYGRFGEPCVVCGHLIKEVKLGGRSSFYCGHCQK